MKVKAFSIGVRTTPSCQLRCVTTAIGYPQSPVLKSTQEMTLFLRPLILHQTLSQGSPIQDPVLKS
jgi:hypothetical protein